LTRWRKIEPASSAWKTLFRRGQIVGGPNADSKVKSLRDPHRIATAVERDQQARFRLDQRQTADKRRTGFRKWIRPRCIETTMLPLSFNAANGRM
jgi:hypothetical protein